MPLLPRHKLRPRCRVQKYVGRVKNPTGTVGTFSSDSSIFSYLDSPATVQFSNDVPRGDVLPTTTALVEVPDSHSSPSVTSLCWPHSSSLSRLILLQHSPAPSITSHPPQSVQQSRAVTSQWSAPQTQPYPNVFRHYVPPTTAHPSLQHGAALHTQAPINMGHWYTAQNPPPRPRVHDPSAQTGSQPIQAQHPVRSWNSYAPQVIVPPAADVASGVSSI